MKTCSFVQENLFKYIEGGLSVADKKRIDTHLAECPVCAKLLSEFEAVMDLVEEQKRVEPRPFAETRILQGIELKLEKRHGIKTPYPGRLLQPVLISFVIIIALAIGLLIGHDAGNSFEKMQIQKEESIRADLNVPDLIYEESFSFNDIDIHP